MKLIETHSKQEHILYDAELIENPTASYFEIESWRRRDALNGIASGRGTTAFIHFAGQEYVLRHYRRGGLVARFVEDRYVWPGLSQTRAWREWQLLVALRKKKLPVPQPVAARVQRQGLFYRADILMGRISEAQTLADLLQDSVLTAPVWQSLGQTLRRFHDAGVYHADLNAMNIMLDRQGNFHLIDFDRGVLRKPHERWQQANILRLKRSLDKFFDKAEKNQTRFYFSEQGWQAFLGGYTGLG
ncbi:3-deoxy-D-manno-octulosonic acid kinase [hydrothermal vent metagenome]|uniref:3-deoxy-D-manno-octulosonic acid kinase n=1 Tax=hydrothermal vent metagenome TaxID=652676 RepID=A0A3B1BNR6_9ZZZZ